MKKVVVINGPATSGKDTFVELCREALSTSNVLVHNISSITPIKEALKLLGWDGVTKDSDSRTAMFELKKISSKLYDGSIKYLSNEIEKIEDGLIFIHIREADEIENFVNWAKSIKIQPLVIHIDRPTKEQFETKVDHQTYEYKGYTHFIDNDGTIEEFGVRARTFVDEIYPNKEVIANPQLQFNV